MSEVSKKRDDVWQWEMRMEIVTVDNVLLGNKLAFGQPALVIVSPQMMCEHTAESPTARANLQFFYGFFVQTSKIKHHKSTHGSRIDQQAHVILRCENFFFAGSIVLGYGTANGNAGTLI
jgi:hypothetical protein